MVLKTSALMVISVICGSCMAATTYPPPSGPPTGAPPPAGYAAAPPASYYGAPPQAAAPCIDPGERDLPDLFDRPMVLDPNSSTVGCTAANDADLFAVTVPPGNAGQLVRYSLRGQNEMAPTIEIFDANRKRVDHFNAGVRQEVRGWVYLAGGTSFFLRVGQVHSESEAYTLALATTAIGDRTEPNNAADQATPLRAGQPVKAVMGSPLNDPEAIADWYRISVGRGGNVAIDVDMSQDIASNLLLYNSHRKLIKQQMSGAGERVVFEASVSPGVYHFIVDSLHTAPGAGQGEPPPSLTAPYTISLAR